MRTEVDPFDDEDFELDPDEIPSTHLDDDEYDAFLADEFTRDGGQRGDPPITWVIVGAIVVLLVLLSLLL